jgi:hypothetical protein
MGISPGEVSASGGEQKLVCDGNASALVLDDGGREFQGVKSIESSPNGRGMASASSMCSHHGPKHRRVVALCAEVGARVYLGFSKNSA